MARRWLLLLAAPALTFLPPIPILERPSQDLRRHWLLALLPLPACHGVIIMS